jgi:hypothetical protein
MAEMDDPIGPLAAAAVSLHELFMAYVKAGFTRKEALDLVKFVISAMMEMAK